MATFEFPNKEAIHERKTRHGETVDSETCVKIWRTILESEYVDLRAKGETALIVFVDPRLDVKSSFLGFLHVDEVFLEFLSRFAERIPHYPIVENAISFGALDTAYRLFKRDHEKFKEILDLSQDLDEFVALAAIVD